MAVKVFTAGQTVRLRGTFTDEAGDAVDPTSVVVTVVDPTGSSSTPSVTKDETGSYHADVTVDASDSDTLWRWRMEGAGINAQVAYSEFKVLPAPDGFS